MLSDLLQSVLPGARSSRPTLLAGGLWVLSLTLLLGASGLGTTAECRQNELVCGAAGIVERIISSGSTFLAASAVVLVVFTLGTLSVAVTESLQRLANPIENWFDRYNIRRRNMKLRYESEQKKLSELLASKHGDQDSAEVIGKIERTRARLAGVNRLSRSVAYFSTGRITKFESAFLSASVFERLYQHHFDRGWFEGLGKNQTYRQTRLKHRPDRELEASWNDLNRRIEEQQRQALELLSAYFQNPDDLGFTKELLTIWAEYSRRSVQHETRNTLALPILGFAATLVFLSGAFSQGVTTAWPPLIIAATLGYGATTLYRSSLRDLADLRVSTAITIQATSIDVPPLTAIYEAARVFGAERKAQQDRLDKQLALEEPF